MLVLPLLLDSILFNEFHSQNESTRAGVLLCCTEQDKYPNGGNDLYDLHLLEAKIKLCTYMSLSTNNDQMILSTILLHHTQQSSGGFLLES